MTRRTSIARLLALVVACLGLALAAPANAASQIGLSTDGVHWGSHLSQLFPAGFRWVPGDSETSTFYVRNQSGDPAALSITLLGGSVQSLMSSGDLTVSARVDAGSYHAVSATGDHVLLKAVPTAAGAHHKITVKVDFAASSQNPTQNQRFDFRVRVGLAQATGTGQGNGNGHHGNGNGNGSGQGGADGSGSGLPNTGADVSPLALYLALGLCLGGSVLIVRSRRRSASTLERQS